MGRFLAGQAAIQARPTRSGPGDAVPGRAVTGRLLIAGADSEGPAASVSLAGVQGGRASIGHVPGRSPSPGSGQVVLAARFVLPR